MDVPHPETAAPAGADGHDPAGHGSGALAVAEAAVPAGAVTQAAGPADAEWEARIEALRQLANTDAASAREQAQAALEELRGQQRLDFESRLTGLVGQCHVRLEQMVEAAVALHRAVSIAQAIGRMDLEVHHLATLGLAEAGLGAFSVSIGCYERALSLHKCLPPSADNDLLRGRVLANFGTTYLHMDLLDKALPLYQQARDDFLRLGHARNSAVCLGNSAVAHVRRAERLSQQPSADARVQAAAAAREALVLAEQVAADPSTEAQDEVTVNARCEASKLRPVESVKTPLSEISCRCGARADRSTSSSRA